MQYAHFLLTRFNLQRNHSSTAPSQEWMDKRIDLFEKYCFPSIVNQTNKNFRWLIYISKETEEKYINTLEKFSYNLPNILHIIKANNWQEVMEKTLTSDILNLTENNPEFIITTRLDNDDSIHKYFIQTIQEEFLKLATANKLKKDKYAINLSQGYCLQVEPNYQLTFYKHSSNPFITLIEPFKNENFNLSTVLHLWHNQYATQTDFPLIQIDENPFWIQVIHSNNIANGLVGYPVMNKNVLHDFGIDDANINLSNASYLYFLARSIRNFLIRLSEMISRFFKLSVIPIFMFYNYN